MTTHSVVDPELGPLKWDEHLELWEGSLRLSTSDALELAVFARAKLATNRAITAEARRAIERIRAAEFACRAFACEQLLETQNGEWSDGDIIDSSEFMRRLELESVEVHESGYSEVHFRDGGLFWGHSVGVRIRPDGTFQEAVVEG
jgi:hypothetical protein